MWCGSMSGEDGSVPSWYRVVVSLKSYKTDEGRFVLVLLHQYGVRNRYLILFNVMLHTRDFLVVCVDDGWFNEPHLARVRLIEHWD